MSRKEKLPPELIAFEAELASLRPNTGNLDTGHLMFLAGQESVRKRRRRWTAVVWPSAFTGMTTVAAVLFVMLAIHSQPEVVERIVRVEVPVQKSEVSSHPETLPSQRSSDEVYLASDMGQNRLMTPAIGTALLPTRLKSFFFDQNRISDNGHDETPRFSYRELRDHIIKHGIDEWPVHKSTGKRHGQEPITREELMQALLTENG